MHPQISTRAAIRYFGRQPDGYGGKAALARALGITQTALRHFDGDYLPERHTKTLLDAPYRCRHLLGKRR
jgi:hypothetical protein